MRKFIFTLTLVFGLSLNVLAQEGNNILGLYLVEGGRGKVQIGREGDKYVGTLVWTIENGALDTKNPDKAERKNPLKGKKILQNFVYSGDDVWENGTIYDPDSGKTYSCKITRQKDGTLKVRGFIGVSLLGRTSIWKRL